MVIMENNMSLSVVSLFLIQQFPLLTLRLAWPERHPCARRHWPAWSILKRWYESPAFCTNSRIGGHPPQEVELRVLEDVGCQVWVGDRSWIWQQRGEESEWNFHESGSGSDGSRARPRPYKSRQSTGEGHCRLLEKSTVTVYISDLTVNTLSTYPI